MSDDQVQQIKDRVDIVDLVNQYVPLKRSGLNHKGLCPFHKEKSPSFMVNPERQIYKCFGCDEGGDVLSFVQKMEGLTFPEALELLADRVGIKLDRRKAPAQYQQEKDVKSSLFRINAAATKFFHHLLTKHPSGKAALEYLHGRAVTDESIATFQLGFAPPSTASSVKPFDSAQGKSPLAIWLGKQGFTPKDLGNAGAPERFRNRIMFPIRDTLGNVVGFTGRSLPGDPTSPDGSDGASASGPKYYNTPETPIFKKSKLVYGLFEGKQAIRTDKQAIFVEGQMDVVLSHQAGVLIAVASSGTAITLDHLKATARYTNQVLIAFDADEAGQTAIKKMIGLTFEAELGAAVITMPEGKKDAGEVIESDGAAWAELVKHPQPAIDWLIDHEVRLTGSTLDGPAKKAVAKAVLPMVAKVGDPVEQAHYVGQLAHRLRVPEQSLLDALKRAAAAQVRSKTTETPASTPAKKPVAWSRNDQLAGIIALHPKVLDSVAIDESQFAPDSLALRLYKAAKTWYTSGDRQASANSLGEISKSLEVAERADVSQLTLAVQELLGEHNPVDIATEFATRLRRDGNESLKASIAEQIRTAEESGDRAKVKELMEQLQNALKV